MTPKARAVLRQIGAELDGLGQVRVRIGGAVRPDTAVSVETKETDDVERQEQARPAAGSRSRTSRRQGPPRRPRSSGTAPQIKRHNLRAHYEDQLVELQDAYPSARLVQADEQGMWLQVESA